MKRFICILLFSVAVFFASTIDCDAKTYLTSQFKDYQGVGEEYDYYELYPDINANGQVAWCGNGNKLLTCRICDGSDDIQVADKCWSNNPFGPRINDNGQIVWCDEKTGLWTCTNCDGSDNFRISEYCSTILGRPDINASGQIVWSSDATGRLYSCKSCDGLDNYVLDPNISHINDARINANGKIAWQNATDDSIEIFTCTTCDGTDNIQVTDNDVADLIGGINANGKISMVGHDEGTGKYQIFTCTTCDGTDTVQVTNYPTGAGSPSINDNGKMSFTAQPGGGSFEIFTCTTCDGTDNTPLTDDHLQNGGSKINANDWIIWIGRDDIFKPEGQLFLYDGLTISELSSGPFLYYLENREIRGDWDLNDNGQVVWHESDIETQDFHIFISHPEFSKPINMDLGFTTGSKSVTLGDFDKDGDIDLAAAGSNHSNLHYCFGDGTGNFSCNLHYGAIDGWLDDLATGDFDNDGDLDVAVATHGMQMFVVFTNDGTGGFPNRAEYGPQDLSPRSLTLGDFDNDDDLDVAVANYDHDNVSIFLNDGTGTFSFLGDINAGNTPRSVVTGDFDKDNDLDLAVANYDDNFVSILLNDGNGNFSPPSFQPHTFTYIGGGNKPTSLAVGDVDEDGDLDLAVTKSGGDFGGQGFGILRNNGPGNSWSHSAIPLHYTPGPVAIGDMDLDGHLDIVMTSVEDNILYLLYGDGSGSNWRLRSFSTVGDEPISIALEDFDKDGDIDLAMANNTDNNDSFSDVSTLLNNSDNADEDHDGIKFRVDTDTENHSDNFSDLNLGGKTTGAILERGNLNPYIGDVPDPFGVWIKTWSIIRPCVPASLSVCEGTDAHTSTATGPAEWIETCDNSFTIEVLVNQIEVTFDIDGNEATTIIVEGNAITCDPSAKTISAHSNNSSNIEVVIGGDTIVLEPGESKTIFFTIDIKPGGSPNCIKATKKGVIPVAILANAVLDAEDIDASTILIDNDDVLGGGISPVKSSTNKDVNGDGLRDLVVHFKIPDLNSANLLVDGNTLYITGTLDDGTILIGSDVIHLAGGSNCSD